jgi:hypothetical protein
LLEFCLFGPRLNFGWDLIANYIPDAIIFQSTIITSMKFGFLLTALLLIIVACSSPLEALPSDQQLDDGNSIDLRDEDNNNLTTLARTTFAEQLHSFYLNPDQVKIVESSEVEWSDTCLGVDQPGIDCLPQSTPGYQVVLEANGLQFEVHADSVGSQIQPATLGLLWTREGGEDELCDRLLIYLPDAAHACWCTSGEMNAASVTLQEILLAEEYEQLMDALRSFSENSINQPSADETKPAMVSLTFYGQGKTFPTTDDQQSLLSLAEDIFARISLQ